ncbi:ABC transporter permease subunit [Sinorhizobium sp. RAC02]|uniref:ABC transporter permease subunit n=1 Tax=Sinorhizobium sp. RAC02 TaxID=1842534 RepID=UPI00083D3EBF|nr:ABC transporter permease subunit [Sinorhizobium sp. RAC02]AOF93511.1 amino ABC transporter, permease, 3-TM region, His/Glu/Gln/Arg/opine family domain protein [Sinorhizobium sp. RAC02]
MQILRNRKTRNVIYQVAFLVILVLAITGAVHEATAKMAAQGMTGGFDFLYKSTGFRIGFSLIPFDPFSSYARMIWVGIVNTIFLGLLSIVLANIVGLVIAIFRISSNGVLNDIGTLYIEAFRNVPLILQALFWYAALTHFPPPKQAYALFDSVFLSARGVFIPSLNVEGKWFAAVALVLVAGLTCLAWFSMTRRFRRIRSRGKVQSIIAATTLAAMTAILVYAREPGSALISIPSLQGLNFRGGITVPPEMAALAIATAIYGGTYIAEVIRAGFISVGKGQVEAARALGLSPWHVFSRVHLPLAIRAVLPTLINQYVWLFKATTLGIVVGFADFFSVISVSINQSGQTLELIAILMAGFLIMNNTLSFVLNRVNKAIALKGTQLRT